MSCNLASPLLNTLNSFQHRKQGNIRCLEAEIHEMKCKSSLTQTRKSPAVSKRKYVASGLRCVYLTTVPPSVNCFCKKTRAENLHPLCISISVFSFKREFVENETKNKTLSLLIKESAQDLIYSWLKQPSKWRLLLAGLRGATANSTKTLHAAIVCPVGEPQWLSPGRWYVCLAWSHVLCDTKQTSSAMLTPQLQEHEHVTGLWELSHP